MNELRVMLGQAARKRKKLTIDFSCRACGARPTHCTPGRWGGLLSVDVVVGDPIPRRPTLVYLCLACAEDVRLELLKTFRQSDELTARFLRVDLMLEHVLSRQMF